MFKHAKKIAVIALAMVMLVLTFAACNNAEDTTADSQSGDNVTVTPTGPVLSADYKIVYEDSAEKLMSRVRNIVRDACGKTPSSVKASASSEDFSYAILIGNTGRAESTAFIDSLEADNYGVKIIESEGSCKIIIAAKTSELTGYAIDLFINEYAPSEKGAAQLLKSESSIKKYEEDPQDLIDHTFANIEFEEEIIKVAEVGGVPYTRMTKLNDGRLMMVYTSSNTAYAIYSSDNGLTWSDKVAVTNSIDQDDREGKKLEIANAMAYQIEDGTILVAYRANEKVNRDDGDDSIKKTGKYHSSIRIMCSKDNGKTYERHSIVWDLYEENIQKWYASCGLWEPHLGMLNGELACFFAIGKSVYEYNHPINSTDIFVYRNNEWVRAEYTSNETPGTIKNGMPVWQEVKEGGYVMAVESNQNNKSTYANILTAKLFTSVDGKHWVNQCDVYVPHVVKSKSGAPYVVQLPNGQIVVSYMTNDDQKNVDTTLKGDKDCILKISISKLGKSVYDLKGESDFDGPFNVLNIPVGDYAIYGGMYVDDTYLYVYSAANSGGTKILLRRAPLSQLEKAN